MHTYTSIYIHIYNYINSRYYINKYWGLPRNNCHKNCRFLCTNCHTKYRISYSIRNGSWKNIRFFNFHWFLLCNISKIKLHWNISHKEHKLSFYKHSLLLKKLLTAYQYRQINIKLFPLVKLSPELWYLFLLC